MCKKISIGESELEIMKVLWEASEPITSVEIGKAVEDKKWKKTTIATFLTRLVHKGFLTMERRGRQFYYFPTISESEYGKKEVVKCVDFWHEGKVSGLLAAFTEVRELTAEDKESIRRLLDER